MLAHFTSLWQLPEVDKKVCILLRGLPLITYAPRGGGGRGGQHQCIQMRTRGEGGGLSLTKVRILYACLLKMLQYFNHLRFERGGRLQFRVSCACFLINLLILNVLRHTIHHIKARYLSYAMGCMKICFTKGYIM